MSGQGYDAFISYRRSDGASAASWLRRELTAFRVPKALRDRYGRKLEIYQDTAYERGTSNFYEQSIRPALMNSRHLIVIATPDAVRRAQGEDWIEREVEDFCGGPHAANVLAVRGAGEFDGPLPADLAGRFPHIEIVDLRGASRLWYLNPMKAPRLAGEKLKLIAPLLGIAPAEMPLLRQEEERRQQARLGAAAGVTLGVLAAVSALSIFALQSRFKATAALESSMFSTGRMVQSIAAQLDRQGGGGELRRRILTEACDLIDKLRTEADREPEIASLVTCRHERALAHAALGEDDAARRQLADAIDIATRREAKDGRGDSGEQVVRAHENLAAYLTGAGDLEAAEAELKRMHESAARLSKMHTLNGNFPEAEAEALGQLGDVHLKRGDKAMAGQSYDRAAEALSRAVDQSLEGRDPALLAWLVRLYRLAGEQHLGLADHEAKSRLERALEARARVAAGQGDQPLLDVEEATVLAHLLAISRRSGDLAALARQHGQALASVERALGAQNISDAFRNRAETVRDWLQKQDISAN